MRPIAVASFTAPFLQDKTRLTSDLLDFSDFLGHEIDRRAVTNLLYFASSVPIICPKIVTDRPTPKQIAVPQTNGPIVELDE